MTRSRVLPAAVLGVALGLLWSASPGALFVLALVALAGAWLSRVVEAQDRRFVLVLFLLSFLVRAVASVSLDGLAWRVEGPEMIQQRPPHSAAFGVTENTRRVVLLGDSDYYSERAYIFAQRAKGAVGEVPVYYRGGYGDHGYLHVVAAFYYMFGYSPVAVKLVNCLLGALLGPVVFLLAQTCFHRTIAKWSSVIVAGCPSLVLWSATNLKDPSLFLLTGLLLLLFAKIRQAPTAAQRVKYGALFAGVLLIHAAMRSAVLSLVLVGSLALSVLVTWLMRSRRRLGAAIAVLAVAATVCRDMLRMGLGLALVRHMGYVTTPGTVYKFLPEPFYASGYLQDWMHSGTVTVPLVLGLGKALGYFLLEPFPWRIDTLFTLLVYPQMVVWYFSLPLVVLGLFAAVRRQAARSLFLVITLVVWIAVGALTSGNVGAVFRIRDMATPWAMIFACVGASRLLGPQDLLRPSDNPKAVA